MTCNKTESQRTLTSNPMESPRTPLRVPGGLPTVRDQRKWFLRSYLAGGNYRTSCSTISSSAGVVELVGD